MFCFEVQFRGKVKQQLWIREKIAKTSANGKFGRNKLGFYIYIAYMCNWTLLYAAYNKTVLHSSSKFEGF